MFYAATHVVVDRCNRPHPCARTLDHLGNLDTFIEEIEEWENANLSVAELRGRDAEAYGDMQYDQSIGT